jgi:predicted amino acid-binding ACT domain protein
MVPGYIVSVFQQAGLCTGGFDYRSVAALLQTELEKHGMTLRSWEPVSEAGCCAVLVSAEAAQGRKVDLLEVRRELTQRLGPQQLQVRIQREDVFLAMHRL